MKEITQKWLSLANYDIQSAKVMLSSNRYLYVAFMCQQATEKYIKAYLTQKNDSTPPYTHNLIVLFELSKISFTEKEINFASLLNRYYINTRYPVIKEKLTQGLNKRTATELYKNTRTLISCIKEKLKMLAE